MRFLVLAWLLMPAVAGAQMYKCADERGVTSYSDKPCAGAKGGKVDIQGQPPLSGKLQKSKEDLKREDANFNRRQAARDREAKQDQAALQKRCAAMRQEYGRLSTLRRPVEVNAKGERTIIDDQAREKRLAELRGQLHSCP